LANIKSAKKRVLVTRDRNERNKARRSAMRTLLKKARTDDATVEQVQIAYATVARASGKGLLHRNKAARIKSQLAKKQNAMQAQS
jgi:small subunit ribosomal protein S20